jgi:carbohydrate-selective porin OprB
MAGLHFRDLLKEGDSAGLIFGQPLFRVDAGGSATLTDNVAVNRATPYHLEGYYRFKVSNNISITPGAFVLFNPEGDSRNDTTAVGVIRTTFTF